MLKASLLTIGLCFSAVALTSVVGMIRGTLPVADGVLFTVVFAPLAYLHLSATDGTPLARR